MDAGWSYDLPFAGGFAPDPPYEIGQPQPLQGVIQGIASNHLSHLFAKIAKNAKNAKNAVILMGIGSLRTWMRAGPFTYPLQGGSKHFQGVTRAFLQV